MTDLDDLRFPVRRFEGAVTYSSGDRAAHIETLRSLPSRIRKAVSDLSDAQFDTPYREGGWTVRQLVHHIPDSHANAYVRFKLALTEDWPVIKPYDEAAWAELPDSRLPLDAPLAMLAALHARWVGLLESLADADFERGYVHPQGGRQSLATVLAMYDWHARHHTAHIVNLRARLAW